MVFYTDFKVIIFKYFLPLLAQCSPKSSVSVWQPFWHLKTIVAKVDAFDNCDLDFNGDG